LPSARGAKQPSGRSVTSRSRNGIRQPSAFYSISTRMRTYWRRAIRRSRRSGFPTCSNGSIPAINYIRRRNRSAFSPRSFSPSRAPATLCSIHSAVPVRRCSRQSSRPSASSASNSTLRTATLRVTGSGLKLPDAAQDYTQLYQVEAALLQEVRTLTKNHRQNCWSYPHLKTPLHISTMNFTLHELLDVLTVDVAPFMARYVHGLL
jgi:hypothetical protein